MDLPPANDHIHIDRQAKINNFCLVASGEKLSGVIHVRQDVKLFNTILQKNASLEYEIKNSRFGYVQVVTGEMEVNGLIARSGDGVQIDSPETLTFKTKSECEFLLFDLN